LILAAKNFEQSTQVIKDTAAKNPRKMGPAATQLSNNIAAIVQAAKDVAQTTKDKSHQRRIINAAKSTTVQGATSLKKANAVSQNPENPTLHQALGESLKESSNSVSNLLAAAKGLNSVEIDEAIEMINKEGQRLIPVNYKEGVDLPASAEQLQAASRALNGATSSVISSAKSNPRVLGYAAKTTASTIPGFVSAAAYTAAATKDKKARDDIVKEAKDVIANTSYLLTAAKGVSVTGNVNDPALNQTATAISEAMNRLLNIASPGKREINEALMAIFNALNKINDPENKPAPPVEQLSKVARKLADTIQAINASKTTPDKMAVNVKVAADLVYLISYI
jgi:hypothetical protein